MFSQDEKVVYPGHGVARIQCIVTKLVGGSEASFYELIFLNKDMTILVPTDNSNGVGLRRLSSNEYIQTVFSLLTEPIPKEDSIEFTPANWSKRNKDYQLKIKSGDLKELCEIYRDLHAIAEQKELSFGEKNLLHQIELLLAEEISLVQEIGTDKTVEQLRALCASAYERQPELSN